MKTTKFNVFYIAIVIFMICNFVISCGDDDDDDNSILITSSKDLSMKSGETSQIQCVQNGVIFESEDDFVATVSASGEIKASHVGSTYIKVNGSKMIKVAVVPKYANYDEPITEFGISLQQVKSKEKNNPSVTRDDVLLYDGTGHETSRMYSFKDGKLVYSAMIVDGALYKNIVNFLTERYQVMDVNSSGSSSDYVVMMVNGLTPETITMGVGISVYNKTSLLVLYFPTDEATRASSSYDKEIVIANIKQLLYENGY